MMLQIVLDHLFSYLPYRGTKVARAQMSRPPLPLLQMRKFFEQFTPPTPSFSLLKLTGWKPVDLTL
jgi:hypothetical protein